MAKRRANMTPMSSTATVQPRPSARALNQSRTRRSRSVSVSRQMPPLAVPPIAAVHQLAPQALGIDAQVVHAGSAKIIFRT
jgi:hypothetical protein